MPLKNRPDVCPHCAHTVDRNLNAAKNIERWFELISCTILSNRQDACSTKKFIFCGTGILPVHKRLIENGATYEFEGIFILGRSDKRASYANIARAVYKNLVTSA